MGQVLWNEHLEISGKVAVVCQVLSSYRFPVNEEVITQAAIEKAFVKHQVPFTREQTLAGSGIIDFLIDDVIGLEIKIKGTKIAIYRQCERYCGSGQLQHLILGSLIPVRLPKEIKGVPSTVLSLSRAFLL